MIKKIDNFTSTGVKFWKHSEQMFNYKNGNPNTVISTHVSPEGICNLNCSYCSVKQRKTEYRIPLDVVKDYIEKLMSRGLKAVILTGGGEPTVYPYINELTQWLKYEKKLSVALITNGTQTHRIDDWTVFSWVRVSINIFHNWQNKIQLPLEKFSPDTIVGSSFVDVGDLDKHIEDIKKVVEKLGARYCRILPNCLLPQSELIEEHKKIDQLFIKHNIEDVFFHQYKYHSTPSCGTCHQSFFRPYLSEVDGGTVYPCDSVVLNDQVEKFHHKYQICKAADVLDFLDGKIKSKFDPREDCKGCVFTNNITMLDEWKTGKIDRIEEFKSENLIHEEFV